jgi:hypothetical protein
MGCLVEFYESLSMYLTKMCFKILKFYVGPMVFSRANYFCIRLAGKDWKNFQSCLNIKRQEHQRRSKSTLSRLKAKLKFKVLKYCNRGVKNCFKFSLCYVRSELLYRKVYIAVKVIRLCFLKVLFF